MKLRPEQVDALGGCTECQTGPAPKPDPAEPVIGSGPPGPSIKRVDETKAAFIGVTLVDARGKPIPGAEYDITLPNGTHVKDHLDAAGKVRIEGIDPGTCTVTFPAIDRRDFA